MPRESEDLSPEWAQANEAQQFHPGLSRCPRPVSPVPAPWTLKGVLNLLQSWRRNISNVTQHNTCINFINVIDFRVWSSARCPIASCLTDVRVVSADHCFTTNGRPGMMTTDQWQAETHCMSGQQLVRVWSGVDRIHPPGHPRVPCLASRVLRNNWPVSPCLQHSSSNWDHHQPLTFNLPNNDEQIHTSLELGRHYIKPEFLIKPTRHWTHTCLCSTKLSNMRVYDMSLSVRGVQLTAH